MVLKPQDIFIALKLVSLNSQRWSYVQLAHELFMSASEINAGVKRGVRARLLSTPAKRGENPQPITMALEEFLIHGIKYAFPPERGTLTLGVATSSAAPLLMNTEQPARDMLPVWPHPEGETKGYAFSPLYRSVADAARANQRLYELLALTDALRDEQSRERNLAARKLRERLKTA